VSPPTALRSFKSLLANERKPAPEISFGDLTVTELLHKIEPTWSVAQPDLSPQMSDLVSVPWLRATYELVQGGPRPGTTRSPFPYDCRSPPRAPIGKAAMPYDFALRLPGAAFDFGRVVCLPFDNGPLDQSRDRRDGHKAGSVMPTHDHLVVHLIENGAVEPYSPLRYRAGSDGSCR
jgi:hypothetical protein